MNTTKPTEKSFGERVIDFNRNLHYPGTLPNGFAVLNPFFDNPETMEAMRSFYEKYYNDRSRRKFIIGINPSRHGAGLTGVPFTDTKRLDASCGIKMKTAYSHEVSSVFMYDVIDEYGGVEKFYSDFYINSPFPLAIIKETGSGNWTNANYYDDKNLMEYTSAFMVESMRQHISLGLHTEEVYVLGKKNASCLQKLNDRHQFFNSMVILEHPRYIQQYKFRYRKLYIDKYVQALSGV